MRFSGFFQAHQIELSVKARQIAVFRGRLEL
jgi:hypothetical protein